MPIFSYTAKNFKGESKTGVLEADSQQNLAKSLREDGYILISAKNKNKSKSGIKISFYIPFFNKVPLSEKLIFTRNLQVMVSAGIGLPHALKILSAQAKNKKFKKTIEQISEEIIKGGILSDSLLKHPGIFSELFCSMIKVGEESGTLEQVLSVLTGQMEKEHELKSKIIGAMAYPAVIIVAMLGIGVLMLVLVIPKLAQTFVELNIELPLTTRIVIGLANFSVKFWYFLPFIFLAFMFFFQTAARTKLGKMAIGTLFLRMPVISGIVKKTNSAYTVRTLGSLFSAGVPVIRSLELTAGSLNNIYYKNAVLDAAEQVKKGSKLAESLKKYQDIYSVLVVQMLEVGEETGKTSEILQKLADFFEEEVANATKNLSTIIEPVLMIIIGAVVGFFVIAMVQPMYGMIQSF